MSKKKAPLGPVEENIFEELPEQPIVFEEVVEQVPDDEPEMFAIFIKSNGVETITKDEKKYVYGWNNNDYFEVPCDEPVEVDAKIYSALKPLLDKQKGR